MATATDIAHAIAPTPERARYDSLITRAVERNGGCRVVSALVEVPLCSAQIAKPFLTGRRHEINRPTRRKPLAIDLLGKREHNGKPAAIVVDPRTNKPLTVSLHVECSAAGEHGVEVRADDNRRQLASTRPSSYDVARVVGLHVPQPHRPEAVGDNGAPLLLFTSRCGDFGQSDLGVHDGVIARRQSSAGRRERAKRRNAIHKRARGARGEGGVRRHAFI
jgi:hypothetical protein